MKGRKSDYVILGLFLLFLYGIAAANLFTKDRLFSQMENRMLAQRPKAELKTVLSGKFMEEYETYMTDQFVARDAFIRIKSLGERTLGKKINNGVYYGEDGYLAEQLQDLDEKQLDKNMEALKRFLDNTDKKVYFALIPGSVEINRDRFFPFLPEPDQKEVIRELYKQTEETDVVCVDMYGALWERREEALFYRTDHHWTSLGAYYGYRAFMEAKKEAAVALSDYTETVRSETFYGTLYSKTGAFWIAPDRITTYVEEDGIQVERVEGKTTADGLLYDESRLEKKDKYSMFLGGNQPLAILRTDNWDAPKLLVIRDSYFDSMAPFLTPHYSEIYIVDFRYNRADVSQFMEETGIDEVFICYSLANFHQDANFGLVLK